MTNPNLLLHWQPKLPILWSQSWKKGWGVSGWKTNVVRTPYNDEIHSRLTAGWLAGPVSDYSTTLWLHLASWNLPDSQLSWESKMEPECGNFLNLFKIPIYKKLDWNFTGFLICSTYNAFRFEIPAAGKDQNFYLQNSFDIIYMTHYQTFCTRLAFKYSVLHHMGVRF